VASDGAVDAAGEGTTMATSDDGSGSPERPQRGRRRGLAIGAALAVGAVVGPAGAAAATHAADGARTLVAPSWPGLASVDPSAGVLEVSAAGASGPVRGTALAVTEGGIVVTHHHVVDGATAIVVTDPATGLRSSASVLAADARADVAVLQLASAAGVEPATLRAGLPGDGPAA
jgi:S1-C subfamily serine protease